MTAETIEVLGPTLEYLSPVEPDQDGPCAMRGTIPPGVVVPLHSHPDPETFVMLSGFAEGFCDGRWQRIGPGEVFHVPGDTPHAWRNFGPEPAVSVLVSTNRMGRFFKEVAAAPERFVEISARYGYWNASPEENARIGVPVAD